VTNSPQVSLALCILGADVVDIGKDTWGELVKTRPPPGHDHVHYYYFLSGGSVWRRHSSHYLKAFLIYLHLFLLIFLSVVTFLHADCV
jgi:hypothetical protein